MRDLGRPCCWPALFPPRTPPPGTATARSRGLPSATTRRASSDSRVGTADPAATTVPSAGTTRRLTIIGIGRARIAVRTTGAAASRTAAVAVLLLVEMTGAVVPPIADRVLAADLRVSLAQAPGYLVEDRVAPLAPASPRPGRSNGKIAPAGIGLPVAMQDRPRGRETQDRPPLPNRRSGAAVPEAVPRPAFEAGRVIGVRPLVVASRRGVRTSAVAIPTGSMHAVPIAEARVSAGAVTMEGTTHLLGVAATAGRLLVAVLLRGGMDMGVEVRGAAVFALGEIGPAAKEAVPAITQALKDEDADVGKAAALAIGKIQGMDGD